MPPSETRAISSIDAREFSDLLVSGRTKDLKILAGRLGSRFTGQGPGQTVAPAWQQFKRAGHCKVDGTVGGQSKCWLAFGETDNGGPRLRKQYVPNYYAAFVLDPDGNIKGVYRGA